MKKIYFQKRIVSAETIHGNTVYCGILALFKKRTFSSSMISFLPEVRTTVLMYLKKLFLPIVKVEKKIGSRKNQEMEQTETDGILTSKKYTFFMGDCTVNQNEKHNSKPSQKFLHIIHNGAGLGLF